MDYPDAKPIVPIAEVYRGSETSYLLRIAEGPGDIFLIEMVVVEILKESECNGCAFIGVSKPNYDIFCSLIYGSHLGYLLASFYSVVLINADGIDPNNYHGI